MADMVEKAHHPGRKPYDGRYSGLPVWYRPLPGGGICALRGGGQSGGAGRPGQELAGLDRAALQPGRNRGRDREGGRSEGTRRSSTPLWCWASAAAPSAPSAVQQALNHLHYNELPAEKRGGPRLYVEDNIDPERMQALLDVIDREEDLLQRHHQVRRHRRDHEPVPHRDSELLKKAVGDKWADAHHRHHSTPKRATSSRSPRSDGFETVLYSRRRWAAASPSCAPWACCPRRCAASTSAAMLAGAADMDARCKSDDVWDNPALLERRAAIHLPWRIWASTCPVTMPYADSLKYMADWFCQLWAESLGKNVTPQGQGLQPWPDACQVPGRDRPALPAAAVHRGPLRQGHHLPEGGELPRPEPHPPRLRGRSRTVAFLGGKSHEPAHRGRAPGHRVRPVASRAA